MFFRTGPSPIVKLNLVVAMRYGDAWPLAGLNLVDMTLTRAGARNNFFFFAGIQLNK